MSFLQQSHLAMLVLFLSIGTRIQAMELHNPVSLRYMASFEFAKQRRKACYEYDKANTLKNKLLSIVNLGAKPDLTSREIKEQECFENPVNETRPCVKNMGTGKYEFADKPALTKGLREEVCSLCDPVNALCNAVWASNENKVLFLQRKGIDINTSGGAALMAAVAGSDYKMVKFLGSRGARVQYGLVRAVQYRNPQMADLLVQINKRQQRCLDRD